jgi:2-keto-4-pentenoate hydratase/2-oxohepta-3-ene-1,7-dioic acid hydratase in catechol pathway
MKIYRFKHKGKTSYGILKEEKLYPVKGSVFRNFEVLKKGISIGDVLLLPPATPSKIIAVGVNYKDHAMERGRSLPKEPLLFLKPPSAVVGPNDIIVYPDMAKRVDYEGELALVIKKKAFRLKKEDNVEDFILGYTCFNDVTARDLQQKDVQFTRAKSFDTFAAVGPCVVTDLDPSRLRMKTFLNGKLRQSGNTRNLIFPVPHLLWFISNVMTLFPGDLITTGTPAGIGPMKPGDKVDVQIEGIGTLSNTVMKVKFE